MTVFTSTINLNARKSRSVALNANYSEAPITLQGNRR